MELVKSSRKIYLVGMMGSGKSHWAGKLGHYFGIPAYDLDRLIETKTGKTISEIFQKEGEAAFRKMEADMLVTAIPKEKFVLATGGGTPCFFNNMQFMKNNGIVLWFNPSTDELIKRLSRGIDTRPVLNGIKSPGALKIHLENLFEKRNNWYRMADIIIQEDAPVLTELVKQIKRIETFGT